MKSLLLITVLMLAPFSFGQKRITEHSVYSYDQNDVLLNQDSSEFNYPSGHGIIYSNEPEFIFIGFFNFELPPMNILCNSQIRYYGNTTPLPFYDSYNNMFVNGLITVSYSGSGYRTLHEYNTSGKVTETLIQNEMSGNWITVDSTIFNYDTNDNLLLKKQYAIQSGVPFHNTTDSMLYAPATNKMIFYQTTIINAGYGWRSLITYSSDNIQNIDVFEFDGSGSDIWKRRYIYQYSGITPIGASIHLVNSNIPSNTVSGTLAFNYNGSNQIQEAISIWGNSIESKRTYSYDTDGFVTAETYLFRSLGGNLYRNECYFYYESAAENWELEDLTVKISPNPSTDFVEIQTEGKLESVSLFNSNGQLVLEQTGKHLDVSHLESGTYILKGKTEMGTFTEQIIKL